MGGAVQAQGVPPPPAPRLPPVPSLPLFSRPSQQGAYGRDCAMTDWTCRIDRLERRVAELEQEADRGGRGGGRGGARGGRSLDISVDRDCIFDSCAVMASQACTTAGFQRGAPSEVRQNGSWQRLVRATCMD